MKQIMRLIMALSLLGLFSCKGHKDGNVNNVSAYEVETFTTDSGAAVDITLIKHGSLAISYKGLSFQVDPVIELGKHTDYAKDFPKADYILVTHEHSDHLDKEAIAILSKESTKIITNQRCAQILGKGTALSNSDVLDLTEGVTLEAVPAYNTTEGHLQFHPKGRDNGFILTLDGLRIYIAGDTEDIPEMSAIKDIDVAFLPVNQPYTMTVAQCINAAKVISPKVLIPYHFGKTDLSSLPSALQGRVSDVQGNVNNDQTGANVQIRIRGTKTVNGDNEPLCIIDGTPGDINMINSADIASVEVLKDSSATAIYGSRGANGVIIVTTKGALQGIDVRLRHME